MPAAKLSASGTLNAMKSEEGNGNDSLDTFIRQAIGKEPLLPSPRTSDSPVQWIQLLNALDQPELPGWPLLTPVKVQMQKCEKCSQEFCSPINYRRHIRVHRRSLNVNKEYNKNRNLLGAFWDKLTFEQVKEVTSFNDVMLKDIPGLSIVRALASSLRRPGVWTLPQTYVKAGATLLDIIQAKPAISSEDLFSILDDASEGTFLCAGTADSVQKYVFDGETIKNSLELKNLVANTSFLFELLLVKAWVADKDAEALRCQKLLVEEEEAAQKRRALLLERKKQKKLRHKEQKAKERLYGSNGNLNVDVDIVDRPTSTEPSGPSSPSDSNSNSPDVLTNSDSVQPQDNGSDEDIEVHIDNFSNDHMKPGDSDSQATDFMAGIGHRNRWQAPKPQRNGRYAFHSSLNNQTFKPEPKHKPSPPVKERSIHNNSKVWTKKLKNNINLKQPSSLGVPNQMEQNNSEVIIGSIPITLKNEAQDACTTENALPKKKNASEKLVGTNRVTSKLWRPVSRGEMKNTNIVPIDRSNEDSNGSDNHKLSNEDSPHAFAPFSSDSAREFLSRRWKEVIAGDHVTLVLSPSPECSNVHHDSATVSTVSDPPKGSITKKPEKSIKFKYIPKQKAVA